MRPIRRERAAKSPAATPMFCRGYPPHAKPGSILGTDAPMGPIRDPFHICGRLVDASLNRITTPDGGTVQVEPKIMQVLVALAERPGSVVSRDELMERVW